MWERDTGKAIRESTRIKTQFNARTQRRRERKRENQKAGLLFAPAERNVYRRAIGPRTALQRSAMWGLSESGRFTGD